MEGPPKERWQELCEQAAKEQDAEQLLKLIDEINRMLWEKEQRLTEQGRGSAQSGSD
jgi:hypothetical protein